MAAAKSVDYMMTYRENSEVYISYGELKKTAITMPPVEIKYASKEKKIAWFVSNCKTGICTQELKKCSLTLRTI